MVFIAIPVLVASEACGAENAGNRWFCIEQETVWVSSEIFR